MNPVVVEGELFSLRQQWAYLESSSFNMVTRSPKDRVVKTLIIRADPSLQIAIHAYRLAENGGEGTYQQVRVLRDVVVVGAGPAGMSAGIYGGSEGLNTLVAEGSKEVGGQAGASSRIENVLGFPVGLSGEKLATDGVQQSQTSWG